MPSVGDRRRPILVIDIGGTHVKLRLAHRPSERRFDSSRSMTPRQMLARVREQTQDWHFGRVSLGIPSLVIDGRVVSEPINLGAGWSRFDFAKAMHRPVRIVNDAAMQALGAYQGGRMLFLGFGTALGAAAILHNRVHPIELSHLPFNRRGCVQDYVGDEALERLGLRRWSNNVKTLMRHLAKVLAIDDLVISGGNANQLRRLPHIARLGSDDLALQGGVRLWRPSPGIAF